MNDYKIIWCRPNDTDPDFDDMLVMCVEDDGSVHLNQVYRYGWERGWHRHEGIELAADAVPAVVKALVEALSYDVGDDFASVLAAVEGTVNKDIDLEF